MNDNDDARPVGQLRFRTSELVGVSFPQRMIELIVIPYDTESLVPHPRDPAKFVTETIARGAFNGIERRANRVRVNRDHVLSRTVGRAVAFYPSRDEGLVAEVKIAKTELGDETLALAEEGCLDASAGFAPMAGGEHWPTMNRMRITRAFLGHIAMTPEPAYETARVLAVRQGEQQPPPATPNLDWLRADMLKEKYAVIDSRYSPG